MSKCKLLVVVLSDNPRWYQSGRSEFLLASRSVCYRFRFAAGRRMNAVLLTLLLSGKVEVIHWFVWCIKPPMSEFISAGQVEHLQNPNDFCRNLSSKCKNKEPGWCSRQQIAAQKMPLSCCLVDDVTADGKVHNRRDKQGHGDRNGTLESPKNPHAVYVYILYIFLVKLLSFCWRPICQCRPLLWCVFPPPRLSVCLCEREHFLKATLLPQKEHGLVPYRLSPSSMNMRPNGLPLQ